MQIVFRWAALGLCAAFISACATPPSGGLKFEKPSVKEQVELTEPTDPTDPGASGPGL